MVMVPEVLTLAMVSFDWAKVVVASVDAMANAINCFFMGSSGWVSKT